MQICEYKNPMKRVCLHRISVYHKKKKMQVFRMVLKYQIRKQ